MRALYLAALALILGGASGLAHAQMSATFSWDASAGADGYELGCAAAAGGPYTQKQTVGNVTTYKWDGLPSDHASFCVVRALDSTGNMQASDPSNEVKVSPKLAPPGNLRTVVTVTQMPDGTIITSVAAYDDSQPSGQVHRMTWKH